MLKEIPEEDLTEKQVESLIEKIKEYLSPRKGKTHRAHLFTVNGYTYPFVRDLGFACVPDPPETGPNWSGMKKSAFSKRRFSMLSYLYSTRKGDLLFLFQADPQYPKDDVENRRGIRGIYRLTSEPFRDTSPIIHPRTQYEIRGECPSCGSTYADLGKKCKLCGSKYPEVQVREVYRKRPPGGKSSFRIHILSLRLLIEPYIAFAKTLGDNRAYMDMSDPGLVWVSRTDNAMGAGKGSSIRTLLPEEAVKWTRMLATETHQKVIRPSLSSYPSKSRNPIRNYDGTEAICPRLKKNKDILEHEFHLNLHIARMIDVPKSSLRETLGNLIPQSDLEYWTSELPWGYTGDTCDFVCMLKGDGGRYRIILFELKKDNINDEALVEIMLYIRWVVQVCIQFAQPSVSEVEIVPVIIGRRNKVSQVPLPFGYSAKYLTGSRKNIKIQSPKLIEYIPISIFENTQSGNRYAKDIEYKDAMKGVSQKRFIPPRGAAMTRVERDWALNNLWLS